MKGFFKRESIKVLLVRVYTDLIEEGSDTDAQQSIGAISIALECLCLRERLVVVDLEVFRESFLALCSLGDSTVLVVFKDFSSLIGYRQGRNQTWFLLDRFEGELLDDENPEDNREDCDCYVHEFLAEFRISCETRAQEATHSNDHEAENRHQFAYFIIQKMDK